MRRLRSQNLLLVVVARSLKRNTEASGKVLPMVTTVLLSEPRGGSVYSSVRLAGIVIQRLQQTHVHIESTILQVRTLNVNQKMFRFNGFV